MGFDLKKEILGGGLLEGFWSLEKHSVPNVTDNWLSKQSEMSPYKYGESIN